MDGEQNWAGGRPEGGLGLGGGQGWWQILSHPMPPPEQTSLVLNMYKLYMYM